MARIAFVTDSTTCLPEAYAKEHNVHVVPLSLHWDDEVYKDGVDITPQEFYTRLEASHSIPTTSQPTPGDFETVFRNMADSYDAIIAVLISSGISGTVDSAMMAKNSLNGVPVTVIDSKLTSGPLVLLLKALVAAAEAGKSVEDILDLSKRMIDSMSTFFVVDTLKYLHKGGRMGGASRLFGSALEIKPILYLTDDGKIDALEKVRTKKKALNRLVELAEENAKGDTHFAVLMHSDALEEAKMVAAKLEEKLGCTVELLDLSAVVGTHVGTGTIGLPVHNIAA